MREKKQGSEKKKGFAAIDPERQRQIASRGGKAAHQKGTAHRFTTEEARIAGRKGALAIKAQGTAHRWNSEEARAAGRKGGLANSKRQLKAKG
jgi:general stress protein YciG